MFRRPELLVAASVPVLLLAGVLSWHRDVLCTQSGCGTVAASAWTGSPVWAAVLVVALALAGAWVLLLPTRGQVPLAVAALTGVAGVVSAAIVVVSLDALVFNHAGFFGFDLPVTETFPVLAVHPGPGLLLGLVGLLLQAVGGWTSVRHRTALLTPPRRHPAPLPAQPVAARACRRPCAVPCRRRPCRRRPCRRRSGAGRRPCRRRLRRCRRRPCRRRPPRPRAGPPRLPPRRAAGQPATRPPATPPATPRPAAQPSAQPPSRPWAAVAFGQGAPPPRRHRRRA